MTGSPANEQKMKSSTALKAVELAQYAEGSVVSRTLADNDAGTITVFAIAEGQGLSEHTAPFDAFVHVIDGEGRFVVGGENVVCGAGDLLLMPADIPHAVTPGSPFKMLLVMLRPRRLE